MWREREMEMAASPLDPSRFGSFLNPLTINQRAKILRGLDSAQIESEEELKNSVRGRTIESATNVLQRNLGLNELDASALAGLLIPGIVRQQVEAAPGKSIILLFLISFLD